MEKSCLSRQLTNTVATTVKCGTPLIVVGKAILLVNKNHKIVNRYWVDTASRFHLKYEKINLAFVIHVVL